MIAAFVHRYREHRFIVILMALVVVSHALLLVHIERNFPDIGKSFDTQYTMISENLYRYGAYSMGARDAAGTLIPTLTEPPLFTVLYAGAYAIFGVGRAADEAMRVLQMCANIGVIFFAWWIGSLFNRRAGQVAGIFAALDLTALYFSQNFQIPDTLLGFFMALWLLFFVKFLKDDSSLRNIFLSTLFLGFAIWTRIAVFMLWLPLLLFLGTFLWRTTRISPRTKVQILACFLLLIGFFFGGWKLRNAVVTGSWVYSSGSTALRWNAGYLVAYQEGIPQSEARERLARELYTEEIVARGEGAAEAHASRILVRRILASPVDFSIVVAKAIPGMFFGTFPPYLFFSTEMANEVMARVVAARGHRTLLIQFLHEGRFSYILLYAIAKFHLIALYAAAGIAAVLWARDRHLRWLFVALLLVILATVAVSGAAAQARYRTIFFPIVYLMAGYGGAFVWGIVEKKFTLKKLYGS